MDYTIPLHRHEEPLARIPDLNLTLAGVGAVVLVSLLFLSQAAWFPASVRHAMQAVGFMCSTLAVGIGIYGLVRYDRRFLRGLLIGGTSTLIWLWLMCEGAFL